MVKRARTLGFLTAFTVLAGGPDARPAHGQPAEVRIVTVRAVADEMYRAQPGWDAMLRRTVQTVSDIYERNFQIRLVVRDVVPWTIGRSVPMPRILTRVRAEVSTGAADVLVLFAAERCEKLEYGFAQTFGRYAMVQTGCLDTAVLTNTAPEAVLSHEVAHLFGGFHPAAGRSDTVMRGGPADRFDDQTTRVIRLMRGYDFTRGVLGLDPDTRRAWSAIYAEEHSRGEPNPLAIALSNTGAELGRAGRLAEAEALLREAMTIDPTFAGPHRLMGLLFLRQSRLEDAARELDAAKRLNFREVEARTELGLVLLQLGREEEALVELRDVLHIDRRAPRAYVGIGMILARRDRMPEAITAYQNAIRVEPRYGPAYLRLVEALDRSAGRWRPGARRSRPTISARTWRPTCGGGSPRSCPRRPRSPRRARKRRERPWISTIPIPRIAATSPGCGSACARTWRIRGPPVSAGSRARCRWSFGSAPAAGSTAWRCGGPRARISWTATC
jgi:Flp pilus assembly protein TadD